MQKCDALFSGDSLPQDLRTSGPPDLQTGAISQDFRTPGLPDFRTFSALRQRGSRPLHIFCALMIAMFAVACASPRDLSRDEARLAAWWCEDWAHGVDRDSGELRTVGGSVALNRIAGWVDTRTGAPHHHLAVRRQRWPIVRTFLRSGALTTNSDGLLMLGAQADSDTAPLAQRVADAENQDRRTVVVLCLSMAQTDPALTRQLRSEFAAARLAGDSQAQTSGP